MIMWSWMGQVFYNRMLMTVLTHFVHLLLEEGHGLSSCTPRSNKPSYSNKCASIHLIMDHGKDIVECSIHDSDIENWNRIILAKVKEVVDDCHILSISFRENGEEVDQTAIKIINKEY